MESIKAWFTPERRKALYKAGVWGFAALVVLGVITPEKIAEFQSAVITATGTLAALLNLLALKNVNPPE